VATAVSAGAFGFLMYRLGDFAALLAMTSFALAGMTVLWLFLAETKPEKYQD
jgi:hypothetical protein